MIVFYEKGYFQRLIILGSVNIRVGNEMGIWLGEEKGLSSVPGAGGTTLTTRCYARTTPLAAAGNLFTV